jgi:MarR family transcriptional regulator, organic hydroperoxide resistance regulator
MSSGDASGQAARIHEQLEAIRRVVDESIWAAARSQPVPLTRPQLLALDVLVEEWRQSGGGLSLSELSSRMGLAHSTVSGIVDRLERRGLLERRPRAEDRRFVDIALTEGVREWVAHDLPASRLRPLAAAMEAATARERTAVLKGVETLRRLLEAQESD